MDGMSPRAWQILALLALLGGCADKITEDQQGLVGKPLEAAIAKYGVPTDEKSVASRMVYSWRSSKITEGTEQKCEMRAVVSGGVIASFDTSGNGLYCMGYVAHISR